MAEKWGTVEVTKNGLRETSKENVGNAAWELAPDGQSITWYAELDPEDSLLIETEEDRQ
jgi:hypothetical protein